MTLDASLKLHPGGLQIRDEGGIIQLHRHEARLAAPGCAEFLDLRRRQEPLQPVGAEAPGDGALPEEQVDDLARLQQRLEIAVGQVLALGREEHGLYQHQPQEGQDEVADGKFLLGGWHAHGLSFTLCLRSRESA